MDPQTRAALTGFLRDKTLQLFADYIRQRRRLVIVQLRFWAWSVFL